MINVAIIEDSKDTIELLSIIINMSANLKLVGTAGNGAEGIRMIDNTQPDVAIIDLGLPDMSGLECISALKKTCPETEFIVYTISTENEDVFEAFARGATSYILKHSQPKEIVDAIVEVHNGGSPITSSIARKICNKFMLDSQKPSIDDAKKKYHITGKEEELLRLLSNGLLYKEIAGKMNISVKTIYAHIYRIYGKLEVNNKMEAVNKFFK